MGIAYGMPQIMTIVERPPTYQAITFIGSNCKDVASFMGATGFTYNEDGIIEVKYYRNILEETFVKIYEGQTVVEIKTENPAARDFMVFSQMKFSSKFKLVEKE